MVGLVWLYWAAGGTLGIAHPTGRSTDGYVLAAVGGSMLESARDTLATTYRRGQKQGRPR